MQEYITLMIKCLVVYFVIIIALRIMGKREVGELSVFDIVIYLVMSELLAISIPNHMKVFSNHSYPFLPWPFYKSLSAGSY